MDVAAWLRGLGLEQRFPVLIIGEELARGKPDPLPYATALSELGATPAQTFFRVTLPNIIPGILSGALLAFVTSFDDVLLALFLGGNTMTLSRKIWEDLVVLVEPTQAAASTVLLVVSVLLLLLWAFLQSRGSVTPKT